MARKKSPAKPAGSEEVHAAGHGNGHHDHDLASCLLDEILEKLGVATVDDVRQLIDEHEERMGKKMAKFETELNRVRKAIQKVKAKQDKMAEDEAAEDAAELEEDAAHEAKLTELNTLIEDLKSKAVTDEDRAEIEALVAEFEALSGPDEEEEEPTPMPEPTPGPEPAPEPAPEPPPA
jgi:hypothetical protein